MNNDLVSNIAIVAGSVGIVVGFIGWYRERRKRLVLEIELLNMPRGNRRIVTVPADVNPERLHEYAISLFTQKRELIDRLYVSNTQRKPLIYSIVLHEDSLDNRQSVYEVLTDLWDASSLDDVHFSFFPPSLKDSLTDLIPVDLQPSPAQRTVTAGRWKTRQRATYRLDFGDSLVIPSATGGAMLGVSAWNTLDTGAMIGAIVGTILGGLAGAVQVSYDGKPSRTKVDPSTPINWLTSTTPLALAIGVGGLGGAISGLRGAAFGIITGLMFGFILLREKRLDKRGNQSHKPTDEPKE